jgi:flavodoxin
LSIGKEIDMKVLIVVESMYGNTHAVAEAVAEGFAPDVEAKVVDVATLGKGLPDDVDVVAVGGPTHAHGMSRHSTRQSTHELDEAHEAVGVRDWLVTLTGGEGRAAVAFDTRLRKPEWLVGSAAHGISRRLGKLGFEIAAPPASFFVAGAEGPLEEGELERARTWGAALALALRANR